VAADPHSRLLLPLLVLLFSCSSICSLFTMVGDNFIVSMLVFSDPVYQVIVCMTKGVAVL
jgi:hypothetical protein